MVISAAIFFSGCTNTNNEINQNIDLKKFIGTWTGSKDISNFGGRSNASITQLIFMDNIVAVTLTNEQGTNIVNYTYNLDGDKLILEPKFDEIGGFSGRQPPNGTHQWNGTELSNDTRPWNGTDLPNDTRLWNGTEPPNGSWITNGTIPANGGQLPYGQRPSMSISFIYSFNEAFDILYLDESQFIKI